MHFQAQLESVMGTRHLASLATGQLPRARLRQKLPFRHLCQGSLHSCM